MKQISFFCSLKMRFTIVFAFFIFVSCGLITLLASLGILKTGESFAMERGIPICQRTVDYIDGDAFEKLATSLTENDPFYEETRLWMLSYKEMIGCKYLYTMAPVDETNFIYIIDGSCDPSDKENFSPMGTEEDLSTWGPAVFDVVKNGGQKSSGLEKQEDWGWTISTYQAITNSSGKIVGFVGVDFDIGFLVETIKNEITRIGIFGIVFVLFGFFLVWVFTNSIFGTMKNISFALEQIASGKGDLTARIPEKGKNELSLLAQNCNLVIGSIEKLVARLKTETGILSETGNQLLSKMRDNITQISSASEGIDDIDNRVTEQNGRLQKITAGVRGVENEIIGLDSRITEQSDAIRQSSAAVEQISANIKSVQHSVEFIITEYMNLVKESENGRRMQESVSEQIAQIAQQSENLTEANSAITEIAEKTNMLAMNAAIEAAHAGDAGRGFGVVADEIRSLAETSATQSTAINELLVGIANAISEIVHSSEQSAKSFDSVGHKINQLDNLMKEVQGGMVEEGVGVESILETMTTLNNTTTEITTASSQMKAQSGIVFTEIEELNQLTENTHIKSTLVASNVSAMKHAAEIAVTASDRNCEAAKNVFDMISGFTVESGSN